MKFFNIDLHVSVIRDLRFIFESLGHTVDTYSLSGHDWVFENEAVKKPDVLTQSNWSDLSEESLDKFFNHYKNKLDSYDGFIVTHTPILAKFYEKFNKPIIVVASTRYEHPFTDNKSEWSKINHFFETNENLILTSNNLFDKHYCELFINKEFNFIESLCAYTKTNYAPRKNKGIIYSKFNLGAIPNFLYKTQVGRISWNELYSHKCIVHFPYNVSTMSIFEQYYANVPLLLPSKQFMKEMIDNDVPLLSELTYRAIKGLPPLSLFSIKDDPNIYNKQSLKRSLDFADFYRFENVSYFDSINDLVNKFNELDFDLISLQMKMENMERESSVFSKWKSVLDEFNV